MTSNVIGIQVGRTCQWDKQPECCLQSRSQPSIKKSFAIGLPLDEGRYVSIEDDRAKVDLRNTDAWHSKPGAMRHREIGEKCRNGERPDGPRLRASNARPVP